MNDTVEDLAKTIGNIRLPHPVRVGVSGDASLKQKEFADQLAIKLISARKFTLRISVQSGRNLGDQSLKREYLRKGCLEPLGLSEPFFYSPVPLAFGDVTPQKLRADKNAIFIIDGDFLFESEFISFWDYKIHLESEVKPDWNQGEEVLSQPSPFSRYRKENGIFFLIPSQGIPPEKEQSEEALNSRHFYKRRAF